MRNIVGILCVIALACFAGNVDAKEAYAGIKGGVNMSELVGDDADNLDSRNRFIGGAFYGIDFTEDFGARLEGLYVMGGAEGPYEAEDGDTHESIISLDYIQFPLLFVVKIPTSEKIVFNLALGPTFSFNTTAEVEIPEHGETLDISDTVNSFEFGALIGGGVEYALSSMSILLDVRYSAGGTNVIDADPSDVKNRGVGVMAGVSFSLGAQ